MKIKEILSKNPKTNAKRSEIDISEAFSLWSILTAKYLAHQRLQMWDSLAHDLDLKAQLKITIEDFESDIKLMEHRLEQFGIKGPDNHVIDIRSGANSEIQSDQFIGMQMFALWQEFVEMLLRAMRTSTTNDLVYDTLLMLLKKDIPKIDKTAKYVKLKGWISTPPLYNGVPQGTEEIDTAEAYHLWDHLTFRYDTVRKTYKFLTFAHDAEFKVILDRGMKELNGQVNMLENEVRRYGLPLPVKPPQVRPPTQNTEILEDDFMYREVLMGIQGAQTFHALALKQSVTNDRLRKLFSQLLLKEVNLFDDFVKFGKLKGWINKAPKYGTSQ
ncbi:DUF3231 family protein [Metallumcola ferriviriculae]|uniref:DUF3231 family protein n=1 Tax=Metallumcola ferriviriculae TaxID=3039180 RepID=A0AAU0UT00_9FIRM|nr:DUF3231 family protein [Desulfitibacteraceae bacterium MK1]